MKWSRCMVIVHYLCKPSWRCATWGSSHGAVAQQSKQHPSSIPLDEEVCRKYYSFETYDKLSWQYMLPLAQQWTLAHGVGLKIFLWHYLSCLGEACPPFWNCSWVEVTRSYALSVDIGLKVISIVRKRYCLKSFRISSSTSAPLGEHSACTA